VEAILEMVRNLHIALPGTSARESSREAGISLALFLEAVRANFFGAFAGLRSVDGRGPSVSGDGLEIAAAVNGVVCARVNINSDYIHLGGAKS
jgi:hypothetical protein